MIKLYIRQECPFCQKVIGKIKELNLVIGTDVELIDASEGTPGRGIVLEIGKKAQVPFMIDGGVNMYEMLGLSLIFFSSHQIKW